MPLGGRCIGAILLMHRTGIGELFRLAKAQAFLLEQTAKECSASDAKVEEFGFWEMAQERG